MFLQVDESIRRARAAKQTDKEREFLAVGDETENVRRR